MGRVSAAWGECGDQDTVTERGADMCHTGALVASLKNYGSSWTCAVDGSAHGSTLLTGCTNCRDG